MSNNNRGALVAGLLVGSAIGAVVSLLTAPRPGKDTRKVLKKVVSAMPELAEDLSDTVKLQTDRLATSVGSNWAVTLDRLQQALAAGIVASQSVQNQRPVNNINPNESKPAPIAFSSTHRE